MLRFKHFLIIEAKIDDYKAQETDISTKHDPEAKFKNSSDIIDHFHKHAPGGNVQHTRWMIDRYKKSEMKQEDAPDMKDTLSNFDKYKPKLPKKRIEQYKSIEELKTTLHPHKEQDEHSKSVNKQTIEDGSTVVHNSPRVTVHHVHTMEAAQELGKSPKGHTLGWCTSHTDPDKNMFDHYDDESNGNFHILHMHKEQFPYRRIGGVGVKGQFQDENNALIKSKDLHDLVKRNPELHKIPEVANTEHYKNEMTHYTASSPDSSKEELGELSKHPDHKIRTAVAKNPSAHKTHLDTLSKDTNYFVRRSVAHNKNADNDHFETLHNDRSDDVREAVAEHTSNPNHLKHLIKDSSPNVKMSVAKNKHLYKDQLGELSKDDSSYVRREVAANSPHKEHLDDLIKDDQTNVRQYVSKNPNASKEHLDKLANDKDDNVRASVAKYSPHKEHLDNAVKSDRYQIRSAVTQNPNASKEHHLDKLVNDTNENVRQHLADNTIHKDHLDKLSNDESDKVKFAVINNKHADKTHLLNVDNSGHKNEYQFKNAMVNHPNISKEHLEKLATHSSGDISSTAKGRLAEKDYK
jgi:hypothetical protein